MANVFDQFNEKPSGLNVFDRFDASSANSSFNPTEGQSFIENAWQSFGGTLPRAAQATQQMAYGFPVTTSVQEQIAGNGFTRPQLTKPINAEKLAEVQAEVDETKRLEEPLNQTAGGFTGRLAANVALGVPLSMLPGANTALGASVVGAGMGALEPTATGESRADNVTIGGLAGRAGSAIGRGLGNVVNSASKRVANIESKVAAKAAADAASETASARSAAGNAAQNAYRQLEHLRELNAMGLLTQEQAQVAAMLEKELAEKAMEKLLPAAAHKEATALAFKEAAGSESKRAAQLAANKLSGQEVKSQVMARLKRYGPAAAGGVVGNLIFPGIGGAVSGAATGLVLRPAIRSMVNLSKNPAVQHRLLSPVSRMGLLTDPALPQAFGLLTPAGLLAAD